jgi:hypothetical protein
MAKRGSIEEAVAARLNEGRFETGIVGEYCDFERSLRRSSDCTTTGRRQ